MRKEQIVAGLKNRGAGHTLARLLLLNQKTPSIPESGVIWHGDADPERNKKGNTPVLADLKPITDTCPNLRMFLGGSGPAIDCNELFVQYEAIQAMIEMAQTVKPESNEAKPESNTNLNVVILPTPGRDDQVLTEAMSKQFRKVSSVNHFSRVYKPKINTPSIHVIRIAFQNPTAEKLKEHIEKLNEADILIIPGGNAYFALRRWRVVGQAFLDAIYSAAKRGCVIAGGSAGALIVADCGFLADDGKQGMRQQGLGICLPNILLTPHAEKPFLKPADVEKDPSKAGINPFAVGINPIAVRDMNAPEEKTRLYKLTQSLAEVAKEARRRNAKLKPAALAIDNWAALMLYGNGEDCKFKVFRLKEVSAPKIIPWCTNKLRNPGCTKIIPPSSLKPNSADKASSLKPNSSDKNGVSYEFATDLTGVPGVLVIHPVEEKAETNNKWTRTRQAACQAKKKTTPSVTEGKRQVQENPRRKKICLPDSGKLSDFVPAQSESPKNDHCYPLSDEKLSEFLLDKQSADGPRDDQTASCDGPEQECEVEVVAKLLYFRTAKWKENPECEEFWVRVIREGYLPEDFLDVP